MARDDAYRKAEEENAAALSASDTEPHLGALKLTEMRESRSADRPL